VNIKEGMKKESHLSLKQAFYGQSELKIASGGPAVGQPFEKFDKQV